MLSALDATLLMTSQPMRILWHGLLLSSMSEEGRGGGGQRHFKMLVFGKHINMQSP